MAKKRAAKATTADLEKKFSETAFRLNQERNDFFLPQVNDFVLQRRWMNLRPEYQRRLVWDDQKKSLFIESLLLNVPIPPVFLYERDLSRYEVMDGQQRLNAIIDFYGNRFALRGLEKWHELNGLRYSDLPSMLQRGLDRRRISVTLLLVDTAQHPGAGRGDVRKLVFERLNTGGLHLNAQELRNCLYAGRFNNLLIELARDPLFTRIWGIPAFEEHADRYGNADADLKRNQLYRRMTDCELVLRFFAFRKRSKIKGAVRTMLDRCMEDHLSATEDQCNQLRKDFTGRLSTAHQIFGSHTFQYPGSDGKWNYSQPLYDGVMVAIDRLWDNRRDLVAAKTAVISNVLRLLRKESYFEILIGKPNTAKAVSTRTDLIAKAMARAL